MFKIQNPYLLFLGKAKERADAKMATALQDWQGSFCVGQMALDECEIKLDNLPDLDFKEAARRGAKTLVLGVAGPGGKWDDDFRPVVMDALSNGFNVAAGMHDFLADDPEISAAAQTQNLELYDLRKPPEKLTIGTGIPRTGKRLLTIGTDCSVGKMYTTLGVHREMVARGMNADFAATGQTGILVAGGRGIALDAIVSDFTAGEVEKLTPSHHKNHWDIIEGQATVLHASYSGVTTSLLHASQPDAFVICHDPSRPHVLRKPYLTLPTIQETWDAHVSYAEFMNKRIGKAAPEVVGISLNTHGMKEEEARVLIQMTADKYGVPCVDPKRNGAGAIVDYLEQHFD